MLIKRRIGKKSLVPYLNERNVVANLPEPEIIWDHPDRETNPLASAPGEVIFSRFSVEDQNPKPPMNETTIFKKELFTDITQTKVHQEIPKVVETIVTAPKIDGPNYENMYKAESEKNIILINQNKELRSMIERRNVNLDYFI